MLVFLCTAEFVGVSAVHVRLLFSSLVMATESFFSLISFLRSEWSKVGMCFLEVQMVQINRVLVRLQSAIGGRKALSVEIKIKFTTSGA